MKGITGIAHVALRVKDIDVALAYYRDLLEFEEIFSLDWPDGRLWLMYLRISDTQYLELFPEAVGDEVQGPDDIGTHHMCLEVDDIEAVLTEFSNKGGKVYTWVKEPDRAYLAPDPDSTKWISDGDDGNRQAWIVDPDGNRIELMQMGKNNLQLQGIARLKALKK